MKRESKEMTLEWHEGSQLLHFGFYSVCKENPLESVEQWSDIRFSFYLPSCQGMQWDDLAWERWMGSYDQISGISAAIQDSSWCRHPNLTPPSLGPVELEGNQVMRSSG